MIMIDIPIPKSCHDCPIIFWDEGYGKATCPLKPLEWGEHHVPEYRVNCCPLQDVPPHGDLIDRNKLLQSVRPVENFPPKTQVVVCGVILSIPAVIPASKEENSNEQNTACLQ